MKVASRFINYVFRSFEDHRYNFLIASLCDSTKTDIAVILVFFTEFFNEDHIPGSLRKLFTFSREEPPVFPEGLFAMCILRLYYNARRL